MDGGIILQFTNLILIPILVWIIKIEKRITRIETILEIKIYKGKEV